MSDDPWLPVIDQADIEAALQRKKSRDSRLVEQEAEIARLRAELATALLVPPLNPDRWRGAINDALTNWLDSLLDDETPKDALRRLIRYEVDAALDPAVSQSAADLVATARREGMEDAAKIAENHSDLKGAELLKRFSQVTVARGTNIFTKREIAAAIRAAAKERKP